MKKSRILGIGGVSLAALLTLTGCVEMEVRADVIDDSSVTFAYSMSIDKSFVAAMSSEAEDGDICAGFKSADTSTLPEGFTATFEETEELCVLRATSDPLKFDANGLEIRSSGSPEDYPFNAVKTDKGVEITMNFDGLESQPSMDAITKLSFVATFPGEVISAEGAVISEDKRTATWDSEAITAVDGKIVALGTTGGGLNVLPIFLAIGGLVLVGGIVGAVLAMKRKGSAPAAFDDAPDETEL